MARFKLCVLCLHLAQECPETRTHRELAAGHSDLVKGWNVQVLNTFLENQNVLYLMENRKEDDPE